WPLFIILVGSTLAQLPYYRLDAGLVPHLKERTTPPSKQLNGHLPWTILPSATLIALSLLISGWTYIRSHERLDYANLSDGELMHSSLPPLKGLSVRGDWLPTFEELVRYSENNIPRDDGL